MTLQLLANSWIRIYANNLAILTEVFKLPRVLTLIEALRANTESCFLFSFDEYKEIYDHDYNSTRAKSMIAGTLFL